MAFSLTDPEGPWGLDPDFAMNLISEGLGVLVSSVVIVVLFRLFSDLLRWASLRGPRRRALYGAGLDLRTGFQVLEPTLASGDASDQQRALSIYASFLEHVARRLELDRDMIRLRDHELFTRILISISAVVDHARNYALEDPSAAVAMKDYRFTIPSRTGGELEVSAIDYCLAPVYRINQLLARYGVAPAVGLGRELDADFRAYLDT